jgi:hypothetical protein
MDRTNHQSCASIPLPNVFILHTIVGHIHFISSARILEFGHLCHYWYERMEKTGYRKGTCEKGKIINFNFMSKKTNGCCIGEVFEIHTLLGRLVAKLTNFPWRGGGIRVHLSLTTRPLQGLGTHQIMANIPGTSSFPGTLLHFAPIYTNLWFEVAH